MQLCQKCEIVRSRMKVENECMYKMIEITF